MPLRHHSLIAWQRADDLFIRLHVLVRGFPSEERYELASQIRRAAYSVAANIVEGFARYHRRERVQFLRTAWASLSEVGYCVHAAHRLGYVNSSEYTELDVAVRQVAAPLAGLIRREHAADSPGITPD